jgi:hypothetical protein
MKPTRRMFLVSCGVTVSLAVVGCGPKTKKIRGKVVYNGKPVTGGLLNFARIDGTGPTSSAQLDENGNFEAVAPVGEVKVTVDNRELKAPTAPIGASGQYAQGDNAGKAGGGGGGPGPGRITSGPLAGGGGGRPGGGPGAGAPMIPQDKLKEAMAGKDAPTSFASNLRGTYVQIPSKYYNMASTDLIINTKQASEFTLELKD